MATVLLVCVVILVIAALVFGIVSLLTGEDPGLAPVEPDGRALPLPNHRSLTESDLKSVRFDVTLRGYRMAQVDRALRRTAYDVGYKDEMIAVLEAEVAALREGRVEDADLLRKAREAAASPEPVEATSVGDQVDEADEVAGTDEAAEAGESSEAGEPGRDAAATDEDEDAEPAAGRRDDVAPVIGSTPTVGDLPKLGVAPTPQVRAADPAGLAASTAQPAPDETLDQAGPLESAPSVKEAPSVEEAGSVKEAESVGAAESVDEAESVDAAESVGAAESVDAAREPDKEPAAERPGSATAPAARSAPKKSTKRAARA